MSDKLVELSEKMQEIRLNELRANRRADEEERKADYVSGLHKRLTEIVHDLEEKAAKCESEMHKKEQEFRRLDNERTKRWYFPNRFEDIGENLSKSRPG